MFRTYRVLIIAGMVVVAAIAVYAFLSETPPEPGRYYNKQYNYSIEFPEDWEITIEYGGKSVIATRPEHAETDNFKQVVQVIVEDLPYQPKLDFFFDFLLNAYRREMSVSIREKGDITIDNRKAKWVIVHTFMEGYKAQSLYNCMVKDKKGYLIQCIAEPYNFAEHKNTFDKAIQSFRFE